MGVGGCEIKTIGYTCRSVVLTVFGPGFNSRRLHQTSLARPRALNVRGDISLPPVDAIKLCAYRRLFYDVSSLQVPAPLQSLYFQNFRLFHERTLFTVGPSLRVTGGIMK